ncbi:MAG: 50S ribosomal protein L18e [Candidatus Helarchaeales archaeon]
MFKPLKSTNLPKQELIEFLWKTKRRIWRRVARDLSKKNRNRIEVNLFHINKHSKKNETILVPGKVLSDGELDHEIEIAAYAFSKNAREKLLKSKCTVLSIRELYEKNPSGKNVKIMA